MSSSSELCELPIAKGKFPFRFGTTSYVFPGDILFNLERIKEKVDDVQLILFEGEQSNMPSPAEMKKITGIKKQFDLNYTIHFPIDFRLGDPDPAKRVQALEQICRTADQFGPIGDAFVIHAEAEQYSPDILESLDRAFAKILRFIPDRVPVCLENLKYDFNLTETIRKKHGMKVCVDTGHLDLHRMDYRKHWKEFGSEARVIHFHGCSTGKDHLSIFHNPPEVNEFWFSVLKDYRGTLILEVFDAEMINSSMEEIIRCLG